MDWRQNLQLCPMENWLHGNKHLWFHPVPPYSHLRFLQGSLCAKEDLGNLLSVSLALGSCTKRGRRSTFISQQEEPSLLYHSQLPSSIWRKQ